MNKFVIAEICLFPRIASFGGLTCFLLKVESGASRHLLLISNTCLYSSITPKFPKLIIQKQVVAQNEIFRRI